MLRTFVSKIQREPRSDLGLGLRHSISPFEGSCPLLFTDRPFTTVVHEPNGEEMNLMSTLRSVQRAKVGSVTCNDWKCRDS